MGELFRKFAHTISVIVGSPWTFLAALLLVIVWGFSGPAFDYSDTWQLVINTSTTIITFLMVFVIQSSQDRETKAIHLKLDELLRAIKGARTGLVNLENLSNEDLLQLQKEFERMGDAKPDSVAQAKPKSKPKAKRESKPESKPEPKQ